MPDVYICMTEKLHFVRIILLCFLLSKGATAGIWSTWYEENSAGFTAAQNIVLIQLVLYFGKLRKLHSHV